MQSPFANLTPVVKNLIIINVICYIATFALAKVIDLETLFSAFYFGAPQFKPWQIITYMFMHSSRDFSHILFNMIALFMFGPILESTLGSKKFFNLYFLSGIGGYLLNMLVHAIQIYSIIGGFTIPHPEADASYFMYGGGQEQAQQLYSLYNGAMVGASGAIFGMLVAFGMLFPNMEMMIMFIPVPVKAKYVVMGYIALELFSGFGRFAGDPVAHFAHLGGALFGFILIKLWGVQKPNNYY